MDDQPRLLTVWNGPYFKKPRLPKTLAWAIGVERLSERFADVPQFDDLQVWFNDHPVKEAYLVTASKAATEKIPQQVLTVWYRSKDPRWYFLFTRWMRNGAPTSGSCSSNRRSPSSQTG